jgi:ribosome assembly protein 1
LKHRLNGARTEEIRPDTSEAEKFIRRFDHEIETGFQLATFQGPLCAEPVEGMAYFLENVVVDKECLETHMGKYTRHPCRPSIDRRQTEENKMAQVTGSLISAIRDACRNGLLDWSPRLMFAMYTCDIQASSKLSCYLSRSIVVRDTCGRMRPADLIDEFSILLI